MSTMPGEDDLVKGQQLFAEGLRLILNVCGQRLLSQIIEVEPGDTLWHLAEVHTGDGQNWRMLYALNLDTITRWQDIHNLYPSADMIFAGQELRIILV